jgi:hypothetical protein
MSQPDGIDPMAREKKTMRYKIQGRNLTYMFKLILEKKKIPRIVENYPKLKKKNCPNTQSYPSHATPESL